MTTNAINPRRRKGKLVEMVDRRIPDIYRPRIIVQFCRSSFE
jgi:hypothetical protein